MPRRLAFDRNKPPHDLPVEWIDAVNEGLNRLRRRKVEHILIDETERVFSLESWINGYLQAHIRRALSLTEGGMLALKSGRTVVTAFCARALLEDAASVWFFIKRMNEILDEGNITKADDFVFSQAMRTRLPELIAQFGEEYKAVNVLTLIERMAKEHPNVRSAYDDLSEVCHPNATGVIWHFSMITDNFLCFDDGSRMADNALWHLIFAALIFVGEEPAMGRLQDRLVDMPL